LNVRRPSALGGPRDQDLLVHKLPKHFDWRTLVSIPPPKDQGNTLRCWDYAACGAIDLSLAIRGETNANASEQEVLSICPRKGKEEDPNWYMPVFRWAMWHGVAKDARIPLKKNVSPQEKARYFTTHSDYFAVNWGFVSKDGGVSTVEEMKAAILKHGGLSVALKHDDAFDSYSGGVFQDPSVSPLDGIDHAVVLIGWDDDKRAWILRNSYGAHWGENCGFGNDRGYMWISYGSNNVGAVAAWVDTSNHVPRVTLDRIRLLLKSRDYDR